MPFHVFCFWDHIEKVVSQLDIPIIMIILILPTVLPEETKKISPSLKIGLEKGTFWSEIGYESLKNQKLSRVSRWSEYLGPSRDVQKGCAVTK